MPTMELASYNKFDTKLLQNADVVWNEDEQRFIVTEYGTGKVLTKDLPYKYTPIIAKYICTQLAEGVRISDICRQEKMPTISRVYNWREQYSDFAKAMDLARQSYAMRQHDRALEAAEELKEDRGATDLDVKKARLQIDTLKWSAEKADKKTFGTVTTEGQFAPIIHITTGVPEKVPIIIKADDGKD